MKLIVNADDFGYSPGVNSGIISAYRDGIVSSASMMVNLPGFHHAVELAKAHPGFGVGIHLVLTCGSPVTDDVPTLIDDSGRFRSFSEAVAFAATDDLEREWSAQIERFLSAGLQPTHLDSHHHVHANPRLFPVFLRLAERYGLPIRRPDGSGQERIGQVKTTAAFHPDFYAEGAVFETLERLVRQTPAPDTMEIMCHPGYVDEFLLAGSSYVLEREQELAVLTDERTKALLARTGVQLITYKQISEAIG